MRQTNYVIALLIANFPAVISAEVVQEPVKELREVHQNVCHLDVYRSDRSEPKQSSALLFEKSIS